MGSLLKPTHLDLFSGVGGFTLGLEQAGFETVAFSEIEPFPCSVLAERYSHIPNLGNVREITPEQIEALGRVDVVTFGSPCQDWSVAGKRLGLKGHRSSLFHEAIRVIRIAKPRFAIFENVPGLFSSAAGWDFAAVLDEMAESGALDIAWSVLDAQWFGVPQRRRRIFLVADFRGERAGEILSISEGVCRDTPPSRETGQEAARGSGDGIEKQGILRFGGGFSDPTIGVDDGAVIPVSVRGEGVDSALTSEGHDASEDGGGRGTPVVGFYANSGYKEDPVSGADAPLKGGKENAGQAAIAFAENQRGEVRTSDIHPQSTAGGGKPGQGYPAVAQPMSVREDQRTGAVYEMPYFSAIASAGGKPGQGYQAVRTGMAVRRLTPLETERLQGFPDGWTDISGASDSARYRAMGNAVAVPVVEWIAHRLRKEMQ